MEGFEEVGELWDAVIDALKRAKKLLEVGTITWGFHGKQGGLAAG